MKALAYDLVDFWINYYSVVYKNRTKLIIINFEESILNPDKTIQKINKEMNISIFPQIILKRIRLDCLYRMLRKGFRQNLHEVILCQELYSLT